MERSDPLERTQPDDSLERTQADDSLGRAQREGPAERTSPHGGGTRSPAARRWWWVAAGVAALGGLAAILLLVVFPAGALTPEEAIREEIADRAENGTVRVLIEEPWGDGELALVRYAFEGQRRLGLGFVLDGLRGWRLTSYTEEDTSLSDVAVGSLLVASSPGSDGQPPWSAATGELRDARIAEVEIEWAGGESTSVERRNDAYLVVREGDATPIRARYLAPDGTEIAVVPIRQAP